AVRTTADCSKLALPTKKKGSLLGAKRYVDARDAVTFLAECIAKTLQTKRRPACRALTAQTAYWVSKNARAIMHIRGSIPLNHIANGAAGDRI
ncbi:hypothetical protein, partial [Klebsiella pneumoniae]|uniref:hypothetical protein n=1 Tax=Klebsiella pneumoniae TaxID=573 RepID=UPI001952DB3E